MKLNPCSKCGYPIPLLVTPTPNYYTCRFCGGAHAYVPSETCADAASNWNKANPLNNQAAALEALQQTLAWALMYRYGSNRAIWRDDVKLCYYRDCVDLLIAQGVLVETDGRITIK